MSSCTVIEGSDRVGGRLHAPRGFDLGGAWTWPSNDIYLNELADELRVEKEEQEMGFPAGFGAIRFRGSAFSIAEKLSVGISIHKSTRITRIVWGDDEIQAFAHNGQSWKGSKLVLAIPPSDVSKIEFEPPLPSGVSTVLSTTPTWMAGVGKFCIEFKSRLWTETQLAQISRAGGPIGQAWDNSSPSKFAICGFVFNHSTEKAIRDQVESVVGCKSEHFEYVYWNGDSSEGATAFGHPLLQKGISNSIFFASTESVPDQHGHMEGAVQGGIRAASQVIASLTVYEKEETKDACKQ